MITVGIDVGSLTAEAVVVDGGRLRGSAQIGVRPDPVVSAREVLEAALADAGLGRDQIGCAVATGYGRERICQRGLADRQVSEISCHGHGAFCAAPAIRTIIDVGGQDAKVIRVDDRGELTNFVMNDKCAAGAGHFLELMSRTLEVDLGELGRLALSARRAVEMSSRCSIFIETEVIHYLQRGADRATLAAGVCASMADRVASLVRRVGVEPAVTMTGGVAKNLAVRREVEQRLGQRLIELELDPQLVGAFGAAMLARDGGGQP